MFQLVPEEVFARIIARGPSVELRYSLGKDCAGKAKP